MGKHIGDVPYAHHSTAIGKTTTHIAQLSGAAHAHDAIAVRMATTTMMYIRPPRAGGELVSVV